MSPIRKPPYERNPFRGMIPLSENNLEVKSREYQIDLLNADNLVLDYNLERQAQVTLSYEIFNSGDLEQIDFCLPLFSKYNYLTNNFRVKVNDQEIPSRLAFSRWESTDDLTADQYKQMALSEYYFQNDVDGRVDFYVHNRFGIEVKGIEGNHNVYKELKENYRRYQSVHHSKAQLNFVYVLAEEYIIDDVSNIFYLFNPFSSVVFEKVVQNILKSYEKSPREMKVILFYPVKEYDKYLIYRTPFKLIKEIQISEEDLEHDKFNIYKLG